MASMNCSNKCSYIIFFTFVYFRFFAVFVFDDFPSNEDDFPKNLFLFILLQEDIFKLHILNVIQVTFQNLYIAIA